MNAKEILEGLEMVKAWDPRPHLHEVLDAAIDYILNKERIRGQGDGSASDAPVIVGADVPTGAKAAPQGRASKGA